MSAPWATIRSAEQLSLQDFLRLRPNIEGVVHKRAELVRQLITEVGGLEDEGGPVTRIRERPVQPPVISSAELLDARGTPLAEVEVIAVATEEETAYQIHGRRLDE